MQKKMVMIGVAALVVALMVSGTAFAQPGGGGGGRQGGGGAGGGGGFGGGGQFDPAQMRQMQMDRMMEQLGVEGDARKALEPKLQKVMDLNQQLGTGGGRGGRGGRGGFGGGAPQDPATMSPVEKAAAALRTTLENTSASPQDIAAKLKDLRAAREKAKQELATAQEDLRKLLTPRQEAQLVLNGQLN